MRSIDSLLHIVVFAALFSSGSIFVDSACRNHPNRPRIETRVFYDPIEDPYSYLKFKAKIGETIDIPVACPQTKEEGRKFSIIYQVDSRGQFDNCVNKSIITVNRIVDTFECEGLKPSHTAKLTINVVESTKRIGYAFEEGKEYYFISASNGPGSPLDRDCDGHFILFILDYY